MLVFILFFCNKFPNQLAWYTENNHEVQSQTSSITHVVEIEPASYTLSTSCTLVVRELTQSHSGEIGTQETHLLVPNTKHPPGKCCRPRRWIQHQCPNCSQTHPDSEGRSQLSLRLRTSTPPIGDVLLTQPLMNLNIQPCSFSTYRQKTLLSPSLHTVTVKHAIPGQHCVKASILRLSLPSPFPAASLLQPSEDIGGGHPTPSPTLNLAQGFHRMKNKTHHCVRASQSAWRIPQDLTMS